MREETKVIIEQSDFDKIKNEMTKERAMEILSGLPRGWFPYRTPEYSSNVDLGDLDNFEIVCAINLVLDLLK